jgi:NAD(P)-dependent dehydrogenase (short-subunit alcohol dehydrogenase family)
MPFEGLKDRVALVADVSSEDEVARYFGEVQERFGRVDLLHNKAGHRRPARAARRDHDGGLRPPRADHRWG